MRRTGLLYNWLDMRPLSWPTRTDFSLHRARHILTVGFLLDRGQEDETGAAARNTKKHMTSVALENVPCRICN